MQMKKLLSILLTTMMLLQCATVNIVRADEPVTETPVQAESGTETVPEETTEEKNTDEAGSLSEETPGPAEASEDEAAFVEETGTEEVPAEPEHEEAAVEETPTEEVPLSEGAPAKETSGETVPEETEKDAETAPADKETAAGTEETPAAEEPTKEAASAEKEQAAEETGPAEEEPVRNENGEDNAVYQAGIGDTSYATLEEALAAAGEAETTIVLLGDHNGAIVVPAGKNVRLELNGHTLTTDSGVTVLNEGTLTIAGEGSVVANGNYAVSTHGAKLTIEGGSFTKTDPTATQSLIANGWYNAADNTSGAYSEMVINGGSFDGGSYTAIKNDSFGKMTINGGTFTSSFNAGGIQEAGSSFTVNGGTFDATLTVQNYGSVEGETKTDTINGGTFNKAVSFTSGNDAAAVKAGSVEVSLGNDAVFNSSLSVSNSGAAAGTNPIVVKDFAVKNVGGTLTFGARSADYPMPAPELDGLTIGGSLILSYVEPCSVSNTTVNGAEIKAGNVTFENVTAKAFSNNAKNATVTFGAGTVISNVKTTSNAGNSIVVDGAEITTITSFGKNKLSGYEQITVNSGHVGTIDTAKGDITVNGGSIDKIVIEDKFVTTNPVTVTVTDGSAVKEIQNLREGDAAATAETKIILPEDYELVEGIVKKIGPSYTASLDKESYTVAGDGTARVKGTVTRDDGEALTAEDKTGWELSFDKKDVLFVDKTSWNGAGIATFSVKRSDGASLASYEVEATLIHEGKNYDTAVISVTPKVALTTDNKSKLVTDGAENVTSLKINGVAVDLKEYILTSNDETSATVAETADGYTITPLKSGKVTFTVARKDAPELTGEASLTFVEPVAKIGETYYASLGEAFKAAQSGETITLLSDVTETVNFGGNTPRIADFTLTIDLNGHTLTGRSSNAYALRIDYGTVTLKDSVGSGGITYGGDYALIIGHLAGEYPSKVIIEGGSYTGKTSAIQVGTSGGTGSNKKYYGGELEILGGTFSAVADTGETYDENGNFKYLLNILDMNEASYPGGIYSPSSITVKGGTFNQFDPMNNLAEGTATDFTAEGYISREVSDGVYEVVKEVVLTVTSEALTFTGSEQKPVLTVKCEDTVLTEEDYTVTYSVKEGDSNASLGDNGLPLTAGSYIATVKGVGAYRTAENGTVVHEFSVDPADFSKVKVTLTPSSYIYGNNDKYEPAVTAKLGSYVLPEEEYSFTYADNEAIGTARVILTSAAKNFTEGSVEKTYKINEAVYTVDGVGYTTLYSAYDAVKGSEGKTIFLNKDATAPGIFNRLTVAEGTSFTLDLGGHTLLMNGAYLTVNGGEVTVKNGTVDAKGNMSQLFTMNGGTLNIEEDATLNGTGKVSPAAAFGPAIINVKGTLSAENSFALAGNGSAGKGGYTFNISGTLSSQNAPALYHPNEGTVNITSGTISGPTAVYQKSGTLNISGGTLIATGEKKDYSYNGNGANATGDALLIDNCGYPGGEPAVSVTGGIFLSDNAEGIASYAYGEGNQAVQDFVQPAEDARIIASKEVKEEELAEGYICVKLEEGDYAGKYEVVKSHTVSFNVDGGAPAIVEQIIADGRKATKPADPSKEGYSYLGWYLGEEAYDFSAAVTENVELTAKWDINKYTVTYLVDGEKYAEETVEHGSKAAAPATDPIKEGHTFASWKKDGKAYDFSAAVTADIQLNAQFTVNKYTIRYVVDDNEEYLLETVEYGKDTPRPADPVKENYHFTGWTPEVAETVKGDAVYAATWAGDEKVVIYTDGMGNVLERSIVEYGKETPSFTKEQDIPTREGYRLNEEDLWTPAVAETVTKDAVYELNWIKQVTVTFDPANGEETRTVTIDEGQKVDRPETPVKEGYHLLGWYDRENSFDFASAVRDNVTLTAKWEIDTFTVTYTVDGEEYRKDTVDYAEKAAKPADPSKEGYSFQGWYLGEEAYDFASAVTEDVELTAKWELNVYTVTFKSEGKTVSSVEVKHGEKANRPADPSREGYTFQGWYAGKESYDFSAAVTADIELTAKWEKTVSPAKVPEVTAVYNSARGADLRFKPLEGAEEYVIMRKEKGEWKQVAAVKAADLQKEGGNYKFVDTEVAGSYGDGFIYSVAVKDENGELKYDTYGLPLYRLDKPVFESVKDNGDGSVSLSWKKLDAHGYEVQYSADGGKTWKKAPETKSPEQTIDELGNTAGLTFRMRCFKDNKDRGRTYSQYSDWAKVGYQAPVQKIKLTAVYNSAKGADIRWLPESGAKEYIIMRKENGQWKEAATVDASSVKMEGRECKYIDTDVKGNYGRGYIYSVALKNEKGELIYDTYGLPLYRLRQPVFSSVTSSKKGTVTLNWAEVEAHGYEVQYSVDNGATWKKAEQTKETSQTIEDLTSGTTYVFRIRCQKTNKSRGTTWSQYSSWKSVTVK